MTRRRWAIGSLGLALLLWFLASPDPVSTASREITEAILQGRIWSLQVKTPGVFKTDYTITAPPTTAPTNVEIAGTGCTANTYRTYLAWMNQSGFSAIGPASSDITLSTTKRIQVTLTGSPPSNATAWAVFWSRSSESHATIRACNIGGPTSVALATPTFDCLCSTVANTYTAGTTGIRTTSQADAGVFKFVQYANNAAQTLTEDKNRLDTTLGMPRWSNDSGANLVQLAILGGRVKYACPAGCEFATLTAALNAITDASSTNRYLVLMGQMADTGTVTLKSYVAVSGISPEMTSVRKVEIPFEGTGIRLADMTVPADAGGNPIFYQGGTPGSRTTLVVDNLICGSTGTGVVDCIFDTGGSRDVVFNDVTMYSTWDTVIYGPSSTHTEFNSRFILDDGGVSHTLRGWNGEQSAMHGLEIRSYNADFDVRLSNASSNFIGLHMTDTFGGTPTRADDVQIFNASMRVTMTATSGTPFAKCVQISGARTSSFASRVRLYNLECKMRAGSVGALTALDISAADADHATWDVGWFDGTSDLAGGASRTDVNNAETVAGFKLKLANVVHDGVYTGAGTVEVADTRMGSFTTRLLGPVVDVGTTCTKGQILPDDGGATDELCLCIATNTVKCVTLGNTNPVD